MAGRDRAARQSGSKSSDGVRAPRGTSQQSPLRAQLAQLQNTAGNRAVQRLVAPIQRNPDPPVSLSLPAKYKDEDKKLGWRAHLGAKPDQSPEEAAKRTAEAERTDVVTKHYSPEEQAANALTPVGGKLAYASGDAANLERAEYAMSPEGKVVANLADVQYEDTRGADGKAQRQILHHSSLLAGGDVAARRPHRREGWQGQPPR